VREVRLSLVSLILANLWPLLGVLFLGWTVFAVVLLFWIENVIVGVFNLARMALARGGSGGQRILKVFLMPFFTVHYGMFTLVHGVFVFALFGGTVPLSAPEALPDVLRGAGVGPAALALLASHGISFVANYVLGGEYRTTTAAALMLAPYGRVVVLHVVIIMGAFVIQALGTPLLALALLVVLKIGLDAGAHLREHTGAGLPLPLRFPLRT
jgi:hypothetical protein